jgi:hypothetical protein
MAFQNLKEERNQFKTLGKVEPRYALIYTLYFCLAYIYLLIVILLEY